MEPDAVFIPVRKSLGYEYTWEEEGVMSLGDIKLLFTMTRLLLTTRMRGESSTISSVKGPAAPASSKGEMIVLFR